jgi:hypothetical protein
MPVNVATVESIAIVTAVDPLKLVPVKPVPMVNAFVVVPDVTDIDPPSATGVPLIVIELLSNAALGMLVNVFVAPLIDLLVNVCIPVNVATVESIAIVTGAVPLKLVPVKPVPIVNVSIEVVIVIDPPRLTGLPLIVIELLSNATLGMADNVFVAPLIDLFVNVCVPVSVATVESIAIVTAVEPL